MRHKAVRSRNSAAMSRWAWSIEKEEKPWTNREKGKCPFKLQLTDVESCKNYWTRAASRPHLPCLQTTVFSNFSLHYQPLTLSHQEFQGKCASQRSGNLPCWLCREVKETHSWQLIQMTLTIPWGETELPYRTLMGKNLITPDCLCETLWKKPWKLARAKRSSCSKWYLA